MYAIRSYYAVAGLLQDRTEGPLGVGQPAALESYPTFSWSVRDVAAICRETDAIST